jgi:chaperonin GroES
MNTSGIEPVNDYVLIRPHVAQQKTAGGVLLPDEVLHKDQNAQTRGIVAAVSPNAFEATAIKPQVGDHVYYARYAGGTTKLPGKDGEEYILIKDFDVLARIEDD